MKIRITRKVKYTFDNRNYHEILPGVYDVPRQVDKDAAELVLRCGAAVIIPGPKVDKPETKTDKKKPTFKKKSPENKMVKVKESK